MPSRPLIAFGCLAVSIYAGCSGAADGGDDPGDGGSASSNAGSGGSGGGSSGSGGGAGMSGGAGGSAATYTAAQACQLFARASCDKGVECGLVLAQAANQLICVQCDTLALGIIQQQCQQDSPGEKDAAGVDRCVANITAQSCSLACTALDVAGCDVFGILPGDSNPLVCDPRCAN